MTDSEFSQEPWWERAERSQPERKRSGAVLSRGGSPSPKHSRVQASSGPVSSPEVPEVAASSSDTPKHKKAKTSDVHLEGLKFRMEIVQQLGVLGVLLDPKGDTRFFLGSTEKESLCSTLRGHEGTLRNTSRSPALIGGVVFQSRCSCALWRRKLADHGVAL